MYDLAVSYSIHQPQQVLLIRCWDVPCWHVRSELKTVVLPMIDSELQIV